MSGVKKWQNSVHVVVECPLKGKILELPLETLYYGALTNVPLELISTHCLRGGVGEPF